LNITNNIGGLVINYDETTGSTAYINFGPNDVNSYIEADMNTSYNMLFGSTNGFIMKNTIDGFQYLRLTTIDHGSKVAIGANAGKTGQGSNCIAIGNSAGFHNQPTGSIILNASGSEFDGTDQNAFYVNPVRVSSSGNVLVYSSTNEICDSGLGLFSSNLQQVTTNGNTTSESVFFNGNVSVGSNVLICDTASNVLSVTGVLSATTFIGDGSQLTGTSASSNLQQVTSRCLPGKIGLPGGKRSMFSCKFKTNESFINFQSLDKTNLPNQCDIAKWKERSDGLN
jgi:hypothetical protein